MTVQRLRTTIATCSPEGTFDFGYGAALAAKRLTEGEFDVVLALAKLKDTLKILKEIMQKE